MRIRTVAPIAMSLVLAACVSSKETFTSDGRKGFVIACPSQGMFGNMTSWGTCFQKAGEICGTKGYNILHRSDEAGFSAAVNRHGGYAGPTANRMMVIECKNV